MSIHVSIKSHWFFDNFAKSSLDLWSEQPTSMQNYPIK